MYQSSCVLKKAPMWPSLFEIATFHLLYLLFKERYRSKDYYFIPFLNVYICRCKTVFANHLVHTKGPKDKEHCVKPFSHFSSSWRLCTSLCIKNTFRVGSLLETFTQKNKRFLYAEVCILHKIFQDTRNKK